MLALDVSRQSHSFAAGGLNLPDYFINNVGTPCSQTHVGATTCDLNGQPASDARRRAGDHHHFIGPVIHRVVSSFEFRVSSWFEIAQSAVFELRTRNPELETRNLYLNDDRHDHRPGASKFLDESLQFYTYVLF